MALKMINGSVSNGTFAIFYVASGCLVGVRPFVSEMNAPDEHGVDILAIRVRVIKNPEAVIPNIGEFNDIFPSVNWGKVDDNRASYVKEMAIEHPVTFEKVQKYANRVVEHLMGNFNHLENWSNTDEVLEFITQHYVDAFQLSSDTQTAKVIQFAPAQKIEVDNTPYDVELTTEGWKESQDDWSGGKSPIPSSVASCDEDFSVEKPTPEPVKVVVDHAVSEDKSCFFTSDDFNPVD